MTTPPRKVVDLRQRSPVPVTSAAPPPVPVVRQGLPLPMGRPGRSLTDLEQTTLLRLGIDPTQPVPPNLADYLAKEAPQIAAEIGPQKAGPPERVPAGHRLAAPAEVALAGLDGAKTQEIQDFVAGFRQQLAEATKLQTMQRPEAGPGINQAIAAAAGGGPRVGFVDDLPKPAPGHQAVPLGLDPTVAAINQLNQAAAAATETPAADAPASPAGSLDVPRHCPHCNWELSRTDTLEITDADKLTYWVAFLNGERFLKSISLLNGRLTVGFRGLTIVETDMAYRQVAVDTRLSLDSKIAPGSTQLWGSLMSYRLALGLDFMESASTGRLQVPTLGEAYAGGMCAPPAEPNTQLLPFFEQVQRRFLPTENIRRSIGEAFHLFQLTLEKLDANVHNASFWPAIGGPVI